MELLEAIFSRRSVRKFTSQPVSPDLVEKVLKAAMSAPSGNNMQSWQFVVISDRSLLDSIPGIHPNAEMARQAALAIVVCGDENIQPSEPRWAINCGNATMNLLLAIHDLGLSAVWCGLYPDPNRQQGFVSLLKLPDHIKPFALVPIGYAAESPEPGERFRPERIHYNQW